jgi:hypothetical protein
MLPRSTWSLTSANGASAVLDLLPISPAPVQRDRAALACCFVGMRANTACRASRVPWQVVRDHEPGRFALDMNVHPRSHAWIAIDRSERHTIMRCSCEL